MREATSHKGKLACLCGDCRDPALAGVSEDICKSFSGILTKVERNDNI